MAEFIWIDWNLAKVDLHGLSADEVEFAWTNRVDYRCWDEPEPGIESYGRLPNGRWAKIIWRYNGFGDEDLIFVITAYRVPRVPTS
jgi:hypothetical protein